MAGKSCDSGQNELASAALQYAGYGWRVLPVNGKKPALRGWPGKATTEPGQIRRWFSEPRNIGVATGKGSGLVVLDIDPRNGGDLSLKRLERELGQLPQTTLALTGGGGQHYLFQNFEGSRSRVFRDGVDFLADGKMFIVTPSVHPVTGVAYQWGRPPWETGPQPLPANWIDQLGSTPGHESASVTAMGGDEGPLVQGLRNTALTSLAGGLFAKGLARTVVNTRLLETNALRCKPPLPTEEVAGIVESVARYNPGKKSLKTQWQDAVFASPMSAMQKLTLLALANFADQDGKSCYPTQFQVAKNASATPKTVAKHLKQAKEDGWLTVYARSRDDGPGYTYGYILKLVQDR